MAMTAVKMSIIGLSLTCVEEVCGTKLHWETNEPKHDRDRLFRHPNTRRHGMHQSHGHNTSPESILVDLSPQSKPFYVDDDYISSAIDMAVFDPSIMWWKFDFSSVRMRSLLRGLSPTTLRLGGSPADWLIFDRDITRLNASRLKPPAYVMTKRDIDNLVNLTVDTGARFLMDLNIQQRFGQQWSPVNALELFDYCVHKGFGANLDWELGNESDGCAAGEILLPPDQIATDFVSLRKLLDTYRASGFNGSRLVGPDVVGVTTPQGRKVLTAFANIAGPSVSAMTFHHYYFRGDVAKWQSYIDPGHFPALEQTISTVRAIIANSSRPDLPMWIGETSDAWHSGTANVSDRYISGFLWMEKLGRSAQMGVSVVIRQTFYGHNYGLLDDNMNPNPDYWLTYIHKRLVGRKVLLPTAIYETKNEAPEYVRVYVHCTAPSANYPSGARTSFALNVNPNSTEVIKYGADFGPTVDVFLLEPSGPDGLLSKYVAVNGVRLQMVNNSTFPRLTPLRQQTTDGVKLPPLTFAFMVFPDVKTDVCSSSETI